MRKPDPPHTAYGSKQTTISANSWFAREEHPFLAREIISCIAGRTPDYEPPAKGTTLLRYDRGVPFDEIKGSRACDSKV